MHRNTLKSDLDIRVSEGAAATHDVSGEEYMAGFKKSKKE